METISMNRKCKAAEVEEEVIARGESRIERAFLFLFLRIRGTCVSASG